MKKIRPTEPIDDPAAIAELKKRGGVAECVDGKVVSIALNTKRSAAAIELLPSFPSLQNLRLASLRAAASEYAVLSKLTAIEELHVVCCLTLGECLFEALSQLTTLRRLYLSLTSPEDVPGGSLRHLRPLGQLTDLRCDGFRFSEADAFGFCGLTNLTSLGLGTGRNATIPLRAASQLSNLESLCLYESDVTNEDLRLLSQFTRLLNLNLNDCKAVTNDAAQHIGRCLTLREISLCSTQLDDSVLRELSRCRSLRSVDARRCSMTDEGLACLAELPELKNLSFGNTKITDAGVLPFRNHKELWIGVYDTAVTTETIEIIQASNPDIEFGGP